MLSAALPQKLFFGGWAVVVAFAVLVELGRRWDRRHDLNVQLRTKADEDRAEKVKHIRVAQSEWEYLERKARRFKAGLYVEAKRMKG